MSWTHNFNYNEGDGQVLSYHVIRRSFQPKELAGVMEAIMISNQPVYITGGFPIGSTANHLVPHTLMIKTGEDIVDKISGFLQMVSGLITILSAVGAVSTVDLDLPASLEVTRYEGRFQLLTLSGNFVCQPTRGIWSSECPLIVSLFDSSGVAFGGAVVGTLTAASPVEIRLLCIGETIGDGDSTGQRFGIVYQRRKRRGTAGSVYD